MCDGGCVLFKVEVFREVPLMGNIVVNFNDRETILLNKLWRPILDRYLKIVE